MNPFYKPDTSDIANTTIARICRWFKKARPNPTAIDFSVQLGVHFEEAAEMLDALASPIHQDRQLLESAYEALTALADHCKTQANSIYVPIELREDFLDSLCDQIVTATGCGVLQHMDVTGAIENVSNSNDSKFDPATGQPVLNEFGKIMKGPAYVPPSLGSFV